MNAPASAEHVGELKLRRFRLGELPEEQQRAVATHTAACAACRGRLRAFDDEQKQFEREIPFERFAGGVQRAAREQRPVRRPLMSFALAGVALAAAGLLLFVRPVAVDQRQGTNNIKGRAIDCVIRVARADGHGQRAVPPGSTTTLAAGERLRIGHRSTEPRHLVALAVDDQGTMTPLYPEQGAALRVGGAREMTFLPDSIELTGAGRERLFVVLSPAALSVQQVTDAVRAALSAQRDLGALDRLPLPGADQFTWLFHKP